MEVNLSKPIVSSKIRINCFSDEEVEAREMKHCDKCLFSIASERMGVAFSMSLSGLCANSQVSVCRLCFSVQTPAIDLVFVSFLS